MWKKIIAIVLLGSIYPAFAGGIADTSPEQGRTLRIAYIAPSLSIQFWAVVQQGIERAAEEYGPAEILSMDSENTSEIQLQRAGDAINQNVDAIIISPVSTSSCVQVQNAAAEAGIPVVICDIGTDSGEYLSFIDSNNSGGAAAVGLYLVTMLADQNRLNGQVAVIAISQERRNGRARTEGFISALEGAGLTIAEVVEAEDYSVSEAESIIRELLEKYPDLTAVFTQYYGANIAVGSVLSHSSREILHVGFDGSPEDVQAIKDGRMVAVSMQQPVLMGREAFYSLVRYFSGGNGQKEITVPTILVTRENVYEIERQLKDKVYPDTGR